MAENESPSPGWDRQTFPSKPPYGWIHWKSTDVCMGAADTGGAHAHVDGISGYYIHCTYCGRVYMCNGHIELVEVLPEEVSEISQDSVFHARHEE